MNRPQRSAARLTFTIAALSVSCWFDPVIQADDTKVDAPPVKPSVTETNTAKKQDTAAEQETPEQAKEKAAKLLAIFKSDQPITNTVDMVLVWVPPGYRVGANEVTQAQYEKVMKTNPSKFKGGQRPVESVTLSLAMQFCQKLTEMELAEKKLPPGYTYTVPTEQQYEFYTADANMLNGVLSRLSDLRSTENERCPPRWLRNSSPAEGRGAATMTTCSFHSVTWRNQIRGTTTSASASCCKEKVASSSRARSRQASSGEIHFDPVGEHSQDGARCRI